MGITYRPKPENWFPTKNAMSCMYKKWNCGLLIIISYQVNSSCLSSTTIKPHPKTYISSICVVEENLKWNLNVFQIAAVSDTELEIGDSLICEDDKKWWLITDY